MRSSLTTLLLGLTAAILVPAQTGLPYPIVNGMAVAARFADWSDYGAINLAAPGTGTITLEDPAPTLVGAFRIQPFATPIPLHLSDGSHSESFVPVAVHCSGAPPCTITGNFVFPHQGRVQLGSASDGLQEAIDYEHAAGGGTVLLTPRWGGQDSAITGAMGYSDVLLEDVRGGMQAYFGWGGQHYGPVLLVGASAAIGTLTGAAAAPVVTGGIVQASNAAGSDAGADIQACIDAAQALAHATPICDASGLTGALTSSTTISDNGKPIRLILPANVITFSQSPAFALTSSDGDDLEGGAPPARGGSPSSASGPTIADAGGTLIRFAGMSGPTQGVFLAPSAEGAVVKDLAFDLYGAGSGTSVAPTAAIFGEGDAWSRMEHISVLNVPSGAYNYAIDLNVALSACSSGCGAQNVQLIDIKDDTQFCGACYTQNTLAPAVLLQGKAGDAFTIPYLRKIHVNGLWMSYASDASVMGYVDDGGAYYQSVHLDHVNDVYFSPFDLERPGYGAAIDQCTESGATATCTTTGPIDPNLVTGGAFAVANNSVAGYDGRWIATGIAAQSISFADSNTGLGLGAGGNIGPPGSINQGVVVDGADVVAVDLHPDFGGWNNATDASGCGGGSVPTGTLAYPGCGLVNTPFSGTWVGRGVAPQLWTGNFNGPTWTVNDGTGPAQTIIGDGNPSDTAWQLRNGGAEFDNAEATLATTTAATANANQGSPALQFTGNFWDAGSGRSVGFTPSAAVGFGSGANPAAFLQFTMPAACASYALACSFAFGANVDLQGHTLEDGEGDFTTGLQVGGGSHVSNILAGSGTLTFGALNAQTCEEQTLAVAGALAGKAAFFSPAASLGSTNLVWSAWVSAAGTVSVRLCNPSSAPITPAAVNWAGWVQQ